MNISLKLIFSCFLQQKKVEKHVNGKALFPLWCSSRPVVDKNSWSRTALDLIVYAGPFYTLGLCFGLWLFFPSTRKSKSTWPITAGEAWRVPFPTRGGARRARPELTLAGIRAVLPISSPDCVLSFMATSSTTAERLRRLRSHRIEVPQLPKGRVVPGSKKRRHDPEDDVFLIPDERRRFEQLFQVLQSYTNVFQSSGIW